MLRILLLAVLGACLAILAVAPQRQAFFGALVIMLLAFLLGAAKLAVDLIDLIPSDLVADAALLVVLGLAFSRITTGDRAVLWGLIAVAFATQAVALALRRARPRHV